MTVVLLLAALMLPAAALAQEADGPPLADVPAAYEPALQLAAQQLGLSYDELRSASREELQQTLCAALDRTTHEQVVADARAALDSATDEQLAALSASERQRLHTNLPAIVAAVDREYCDEAATGDDGEATPSGGADAADAVDETGATPDADEGATGDAGEADDDAVTTVDDIPVPNRVDTGGGGAGDGQQLPAAFGALFATLFGALGVAATARRRA